MLEGQKYDDSISIISKAYSRTLLPNVILLNDSVDVTPVPSP